MAPDESRVLRLVPYTNRKTWPAGVPTEILETTENRYTLDELAADFGTIEGTSFSRNEILAFTPRPFVDDTPQEGPTADSPTVEDMGDLAERAEGVRRVLEIWIKRNMKPGIHWGIIPIDGKEASKPTLLKPGAELVALLYGWRFHFQADLESLQMVGPMTAGTFAYTCHVIDRHGGTVGQGRGVAELREPGMNNANKTVKMALKRAQVDAILRCAGLSQWFTQDLEEPQFVAPEVDPNRATPAQCQDIRAWLKMAGKTEDEILTFYGVGTSRGAVERSGGQGDSASDGDAEEWGVMRPGQGAKPRPVVDRRVQELQETIQGIARVLQREQPNRTISELWADALSIYRVQYERVALPPPSEE